MSNSNISILFVDDDRFLLDMYSVKFSNNGYSVQTASNAEDALRILRGDFKPEIIVLDMVMPGMGGLDIVEVIRKESLIPNAIIVILTNQNSATDIERARSLKVDGYIVKATSIPSEVLNEINRLYKERGQAKT